MSEKKARKEGADASDLRAVLAAVGAPKDDTQWKRLLKYEKTEAFRQALDLIGDWRGLFKVTTEVARMFRFVQGRFQAVCDEPQLHCTTDEWLQQKGKDGQALARDADAFPDVPKDQQFTREELLEILFSHDAVPLEPNRTGKLKVANCFWRQSADRRAFPLGDAKCKALLGPVLVTLSTHKAASSIDQELTDLTRVRTRLLTLLAGMDGNEHVADDAKRHHKKSKKDKHAKRDKKKDKKKKKKAESSSASASEEEKKSKKQEAQAPTKKWPLVAVDEPTKAPQFDLLANSLAPPVPRPVKVAPLMTVVTPTPTAITTPNGVAAALNSVERYRVLHGWFKSVTDARNNAAVY